MFGSSVDHEVANKPYRINTHDWYVNTIHSYENSHLHNTSSHIRSSRCISCLCVIFEAGHRSVTAASNRGGAPRVTVNALFNSIFARVCLYVFSVSLRVMSLRNKRARPWLRRLVTGLSPRVQSQIIPCGMCGGQCVGGTDFSPSISVSPYQHYSTNISYSFAHLSPTPYICNWQRRRMTFFKKNFLTTDRSHEPDTGF